MSSLNSCKVIRSDRPAGDWEEAYPIGNGRIGAMVFGGVNSERVQINEETFWSGHGPARPNPAALDALMPYREMMQAEDYDAAWALANESMMGQPAALQGLMPLVDLEIVNFFEWNASATRGYHRRLDMAEAIVSLGYTKREVIHAREYFASAADQVLIARLTANDAGAVAFSATLSSLNEYSVEADGPSSILVRGCWDGDRKIPFAEFVLGSSTIAPSPGKGIEFAVRLAVRADGKIRADRDGLHVADASRATLIVSAATSFGGEDPVARTRAVMNAVADKDYATLRRRHVADHRKYFDRVSLELSGPAEPELTTEDRLSFVAGGGEDAGLDTAIFDFGRYLLLASSRPGCLPPTLQGKWNNSRQPAWGAKYTTNINLQMNYWPAEPTNLAEMHETLFDFIESLVPSGQETARAHYGARGWVLHHNSDIWRSTTPTDFPQSGSWPMGAAWLCTHLWEHYQFNLDAEFLARAYPLMKGAAEFIEDFLIENAAGQLVTSPSVSPENFYRSNGQVTAITIGAMMDFEIIRHLYRGLIEASAVLGKDDGFVRQLEATLARLPQYQVGAAGEVMEWMHPYEETEPGHRHYSHLYGLYPGCTISPDTTPLLSAAASISLVRRMEGECCGFACGTGWSLMHAASLYARLKEGNRAYWVLQVYLRESALANLFGTHPPFQIDASFGATAVVAEMLLQSHAGAVELLPAMPTEAWLDGKVSGLRARGAFDVSMEWRSGHLLSAQFVSHKGSRLNVRYRGRSTGIETRPGCTYTINLAGGAPLTITERVPGNAAA